ncbi:MAG: hypothetical protein ABI353_22105 [Isosphaeraceae bacterium]
MSDTSPVEGPTPGRGGWSARGDLTAAALCVAVGVAISILPHLIWWPRLGAPVYVADRDDMLYLAVAGQAYDNHPTYLGDPSRATPGSGIYQWLIFVPGILVARVLGWGPMGVDLAWRTLAGAGIALGWYACLRQYFRRPWVAAALAIVLLVDIGTGRLPLLVRPLDYAIRLGTGRVGTLFASFPTIHVQWRLINPGLSLPFLLLHLALLARARSRPTCLRLAWSGLGMGLLFYVYFYYWTAAGLALVLALAVDTGHRRVYLATGLIGGLVGLPSVLASAALKRSTSPDWLPRSDMFLPIPRFSEILVPKLAIILLVVGLAWVWVRRRDLIYPMALATAGLVLLNHQVVTGLQIQNFHWNYVWNIGFSYLYVLLIAGALFERPTLPRWAVAGLMALCLVEAGAGFWFRAEEASRTQQTREILAEYRRYREQRQVPVAPRLVANAGIAGARDFVDLAAVLENQRPLEHYAAMLSPAIDDAEWDRRLALNAALLGLDRPAFAAHARYNCDGWGPWSRDPSLRAQRLDGLLRTFDALRADPTDASDAFGVRYVAIETTRPPPAYLRSGWRLLQDGPSWRVWERRPASRTEADGVTGDG